MLLLQLEEQIEGGPRWPSGQLSVQYSCLMGAGLVPQFAFSGDQHTTSPHLYFPHLIPPAGPVHLSHPVA